MTRTQAAAVFALLSASTLLLFPQTRGAAPLAFEVVSIKPAMPGTGNISGCRGIDTKLTSNDVRANVPLGTCLYNVTRLTQLINQAYDLQAIGAIRGVPDWDRGSLYRIEAKAENPASTTEKQLFEMLRNLLADRFKLKYHRATEDVAGFALVQDKGGSKLMKSTVDGDEDFMLLANNPPGTASLTAQKMSMASVAKNLSTVNLCIGVRGPIAPVVDRTGLTGFYAFKLTWDMCRGENSENLDRAIRFTIKDQLGLTLESAKVPYEFFVIDFAEKAMTN